MITKFVESEELGKVSSIMAAMDGLMPVLNSLLYSSVYRATVATSFPQAHFLVGVAAGLLMVLVFGALGATQRARSYDLEKAAAPEPDKSCVVLSYENNAFFGDGSMQIFESDSNTCSLKSFNDNSKLQDRKEISSVFQIQNSTVSNQSIRNIESLSFSEDKSADLIASNLQNCPDIKLLTNNQTHKCVRENTNSRRSARNRKLVQDRSNMMTDLDIIDWME